ncbi:MAG: glycine cleavage system aminomethyltransferase GcvT [Microthrixaceae bacterium]
MQLSPLDSVHRGLEAKMVPFGGWEMPLSYPSGTLEEHRLCRTDAVAFDVSHLGTVRVQGPDAFDSLQRTLTNDLKKIQPGRAQYTHLLDPETASVLDDIIVWWVAPEVFDVMPNASNTEGVSSALAASATGKDLTISETTSERAVIAIQGPNARKKLETVLPEVAKVGRFGVLGFSFEGQECIVAGTGYTGEDGVECAVPVSVALSFWNLVMSAGVSPAGLGARDTLRLEAGLPLHGHELGHGMTTLNARLGWVVSWEKGDFLGRDALEQQQTKGVAPLMYGLKIEGRRPPRAEQKVLRDGLLIGELSSGNFSPTLGYGIALAFLDPSVQVGDTVMIDQRGSQVSAEVVKLPFLAK